MNPLGQSWCSLEWHPVLCFLHCVYLQAKLIKCSYLPNASGDTFQLHLNIASFFCLSQASVAVMATVSQLLDANKTEFNDDNLVNITSR